MYSSLRQLFLACFLLLNYCQNVFAVDTRIEDYGRHVLMSAIQNARASLPKVLEELRQASNSLDDTVVSDKCEIYRNHSISLFTLQDQNPPEWVLKLFDATGKPPTGVLDGNFQWLGSYTECLKVRVYQDNSSTELDFQGKYCTANVEINTPAAQSQQKDTDTNGILGALPISLNVLWGICLPSSCNEMEITEQIAQWLSDFQISSITVTVENGTCHIDEPKKFDGSSIAVIILYSLFALLMIVGTFYEVVILWRRDTDTGSVALLDTRVTPPRNSLLERILVSFSVYKNGKKLLSTKQSEGTLTCIHGIRFFSMSWVVLGHSYMFAMQSLPIKNLAVAADVIRDIFFDTILNGTFSVDTFFFLSGFLVAYLFLKEMKKSGGDFGIRKLFLFYFHRYWRLTPPFALGIAFVSGILIHISSGPSWQEQNVSRVDNCRTYWWRNMLYIHNLYDIQHMCFEVSWYLGCDMQFYLVSLLIIYPLYKMRKLGLGILSLFFIATTVTPALIIHYDDLSALVAGDVGGGPNALAKSSEFMQKVYMVPWCRMGPYLVGILLAVFLDRKMDLKVKLHPLFVLIGWLLATILGLVLIYSTYSNFTGDVIMSNAVNSIYGALSRTAWGVMLSWVLFACVTGHGGYVNTILSWKGLIPLSRLTYSSYLVHWYVMIAFFASQESTYFFNHYFMTLLYLGFLVVTMGVAFVFSLAFEAPLLELEKIFLPSRMKSKEPQKLEANASEPNGLNKQYGTYSNNGFESDEKQTYYNEDGKPVTTL